MRLHGVWAITEAGTPTLPLARGGVPDVEALCRGVIRSLTSADPLPLDDELETLSQLFEQTVKLQAAYDPTKAGILFRPWLYSELQRDAIDFWRTFYGRKGEKRVADSRRLDAAARDAGVDDGAPGMDRPDPASEAGEDGAPGDRAFPREWTDLSRDRRADRPVGGLRRGEGHLDPAVDGRRGAQGRGQAVGRVAGADRGSVPWIDCLTCGIRNFCAPPNGIDAWHFAACVGCGSTLELVPDYPPKEALA